MYEVVMGQGDELKGGLIGVCIVLVFNMHMCWSV